jgi:hypothetical protein
MCPAVIFLDMFRLTYSYIVSKNVKIMYQTNTNEKRHIKVATAFKVTGKYYSKQTIITPKIILQGNYLQRANFNPKDMVEESLKNGAITLKKI